MSTTTERRHAGKRNSGCLITDGPEQIDRDPDGRFFPTSSQIRYRMRLVTAMEGGEPINDTAICRALRMSRQTLWEWRQDADFRKWLKVTLDDGQKVELRCAISRHLHSATQGSMRSFEMLVRLKEMGVF